MANVNKEKKKQLFNSAAAMNPALAQAKTWITVILILLIATRVVSLLLQSYCVGKGYLINTSAAANYASVAVMVLFSICIVNGAKGLAILPIAGGVAMVVQTFISDFNIMLSPLYDIPLVLRLYAVSFILTSYGQVICMLLILLPKKCRTYFAVMTAINKQITSGTMELPKE